MYIRGETGSRGRSALLGVIVGTTSHDAGKGRTIQYPRQILKDAEGMLCERYPDTKIER